MKGFGSECLAKLCGLPFWLHDSRGQKPIAEIPPTARLRNHSKTIQKSSAAPLSEKSVEFSSGQTRTKRVFSEKAWTNPVVGVAAKMVKSMRNEEGTRDMHTKKKKYVHI